MTTANQTKKMVTLKINGQDVQVEEGTYVIAAAKKAGIEVPHFCYHPQLAPDANCRMCLVEIEKNPKLQTSCSMPVAEGMVVQTHSPNVLQARNGVIEFILSNHPLDCPICDKGGECHLQDLSHEYSKQGRFTEEKRVFNKEYFGGFIEKEMNRCVSCLRCVRYCDEIMEVRALGSVERGVKTEITTFARQELDCVFCGGCVQICPVGALTNRFSMYQFRPWELKKTETVCQHCADGCQMTLETYDSTLMRVTSEWGKGPNEGNLCAKGFYGYHYVNEKDRLTSPMVRFEKKLVGTLWDEALDLTAKKINEIRSRHGNQAIAGIISARCTNEEVYLFQKWLRLGIGTPHIDSTARYGHINTVKAFREAFGYNRMLNSYEEISQAKVILVIGSDMTESNPVSALSVKKAVRKGGAKLIVVDPVRTNLAKLPGHHLQNRLGTEGVVTLGLIKAILEIDGNPYSAYPYGVQLKSEIKPISFNKIEEMTGISEREFRKMGQLLYERQPGVILFGTGITSVRGGYDHVKNLIDLAWVSGKLDQAGSGLNPLCYENNEQGVVEMGGVPEFLPGLMEVGDPAAQKLYADLWHGNPVLQKGATLPEMIKKIHRGEIKMLYIIGENPIDTLPASLKVKEAFSKLDFLVCQDLFMNSTLEMADVVFPAASFAEKEGTYTSMEGKVQRIRKALNEYGESQPDWSIISAVSTRAGFPLQYENVNAIRREIKKVLPDYYRELPVGPEQKEMIASKKKIYFNPIVSKGNRERFRFEPLSSETGRASDEFALMIRPVLYHSGKMSTRAVGLNKLYPDHSLTMNPEDAKKLGVSNGDRVRVKSGERELQVKVKMNPDYPRGVVFYPQHLVQPNLRDLLPCETDPVTDAVYFKLGKVEILPK
ncbi:MAG: NADH-quinone oxidoreductase subunit NuoG [Nitrospirae bacterium]|nr:NADH-quinone oxidoreductase subunit NuoG [Nitrospirota bacterium]